MKPLVKQDEISIDNLKIFRVRISKVFLIKFEAKHREILKYFRDSLWEALAGTEKSTHQFLLKEIENGHIDGSSFKNKHNNDCGCIYGTILKHKKIDIDLERTQYVRKEINQRLIKNKIKFQIDENEVTPIEEFVFKTTPGLTNKNYLPLALVHKWIEEYDQEN